MKNYISIFFCILLFNKVAAQVPVMDPIAGSATVCSAPSPAQSFTASASNSPTSYSWSVVPSASVAIANASGSVSTISFPDNAISYTVYCSATNASGTGSASALFVTVYGTPDVTFSGATTFCQGSGTNLMASSTVVSASPTNLSASSTLYGWNPATGLNMSYGPSVIASPTVTTTYTVVGVLGNCYNSNTITVYPFAVHLSGPGNFCQGSSVTLSASVANTFTGSGITYSWLPSAGLNTSSGLSVTASPPVTTSYSVFMTNGVCNSMDTLTLHTNPTLILPGSTSLCQGSSVSLPAGASFTSNATYSWSPATGLNTSSGPNVIASPTASVIYTVTLTSGVCSSSGTVGITVNTISPVAVSGATGFCQGASVTLTASPTNTAGSGTYSWAPSTGLNTTTGSVVTANPTAPVTYSVVFTNGLCSRTATITVAPNPLIVLPGATNLCQGSSVNLSAGASFTASNITYSWSPSTGLNSSSNQNVTASPSASIVYTVTLSNGACASSGSVSITVNTVSPVSVSGGTSFCQGASVTLTATPTGTPAPGSYSWLPATGLNTTTGSVVVASPTTAMTYTVFLVNGACTSTASIAVTTNPLVNITGPGSFCQGSMATLLASATGTSASALSYSWTPATGLNTTSGASVIASPTISSTYTVVLTAGTCASTNTILINTNPSVTVSGPTSFCQGASVTLSASPAYTASSSMTYSWLPSAGLNTTSGISVIASPLVNTTYTVVLSNLGCTSTRTVTVSTNPLVTATVPAAICAGASAALTAGPSFTTSASLSYSWTPATGLNTTTGASVVANPSASTTYTVLLTSGTCTSSNTVLLTVNTLSPINISGQSIICQGASASLTATPTGASGSPVSYSWMPSAGLNTTSGTSVIASPAASVVYTVLSTSGACAATTTLLLLVNPTPSLTISGPTSFCQGAPATLSVNASLPGLSYVWTPASGLNTSSGASVMASPAVNTTYTVTSISNGCTGTATLALTTNPVVSLSGSTTTLCEGASAAFYASPSFTSANVSYSWMPSAGLNITTGTAVVASPAASTTYTVILTSGACTSTNTINVHINPTPVAVISGPSSFCQGASAALSANVTNTSGTVSYSWIPSYGLNTTSGPNVVASPTTAVTYTVLLVSGGCSGSNTVTVNTNPYVAVSGATVFCQGLSTTLSASPIGSSNAPVSYSWAPASGLDITTGTTVVASPSVNTTYSVTLTSGGCTSTGIIAITATDCATGIKTNRSNDAGLTVYPNPTSGTFIIKTDKKETVILIDELGQTIETYVTLPGEETRISGLAAGVYFIVTPSSSKKIIVVSNR